VSGRTVAHRGADAVSSRVASADHNDVLVLGADVVAVLQVVAAHVEFERKT